MNVRQRLLKIADRIVTLVLASLLTGTTLAFGGAVWWARPMIAGLTSLLVIASLARVALEGRMRVLKSPLTALGALALALAAVQLSPLPPRVAEQLSPRSRAAYALGFFPERARAAGPGLALPEPAGGGSPVTLDRSGTLQWLAGATACLALFWSVSLFADRLGRLYVVWGSIIAAFFFNTSFALVQLVSRSGHLFGLYDPGLGPWWTPSVGDLLATPNTTALRALDAANAASTSWAVPVPDRPFLIGSLMGGPGAFLALGTIGLPLALALILQLLAPRGSREGLRTRLGDSGQGGLVVLLIGLLWTSAVLIGLMAGRWLSLPFAISLVLVGLPSARPSGLRWLGLVVTLLSVLALGGGILLGEVWSRIPDARPLASAEGLETATRVWADAWAILRDFPVLGTGLGSFASIFPLYKSCDEARTTALSSLLQWWVEAGAVGVALLVVALLWCLYRLPGAVRRVGTADRALAFGMIGAAAGFGLFSAVHWTVELAAVAVAASALGGAGNRWLAGGTDLFVERG
ncbi:MAG: O-antigen ligase family protein [Planctomycetaceae bacterium]|nr:O-antigen ligase family protein [Planctomycetaceae bacterium]